MAQPEVLHSFALEELSWQNAVGEISSVNNEFAKTIDKLAPAKHLTVFKATYPYGAKIFECGVFNLPLKSGKTLPANSMEIPEILRRRLLYNVAPVCLVLQNNCEVFSDFDTHFTSFQILSPGETFGTWEIHETEQLKANAKTCSCYITAGTRTAVMLPKITVNAMHNKLREKYKFHLPPPKYFQDHHEVFKKIAQHANFSESWQNVIFIFPVEWVDRNLNNNFGLWTAFNYLLLKDAWRQTIKWRSYQVSLMWQTLMPEISEMKNEPRHYIVDTVKRLLLIGLGGYPAFAPTTNSMALPIKGLQKAYIEDYKLDRYIPTIMEPQHLLHTENSQPLYYSLQCPELIEYSFALSHSRSAMQDLEDVKLLMDKLLNKLKTEKTHPFDIMQHLKFDYYHAEKSRSQGIQLSDKLAEEDPRFRYLTVPNKNLVFAKKASFARGCIKISYIS